MAEIEDGGGKYINLLNSWAKRGVDEVVHHIPLLKYFQALESLFSQGQTYMAEKVCIFGKLKNLCFGRRRSSRMQASDVLKIANHFPP